MNQATTAHVVHLHRKFAMRAIKNVRLRDYDYSSDGFYFVTICTDHRRPLLEGRCKETVCNCVEELPLRIGGVKVDYYQVLPSHVHLILAFEQCSLALSEVVRRLKAVSTRQAGFRLWQPNYYEHVIRSERALARIREYVRNNPLAEEIEVELFYEV